MKDFLKENKVQVVVSGILLGVVGFISFLRDFATTLLTKICITIFLFIAFAMFFWIYYLYYKIRSFKRQQDLLSEEVRDIKRKGESKLLSKFDRFEAIKRNKSIKYGYISYKPFFWTEDTLNHKGIGKELLSAVFGEQLALQPYEYPKGQAGGNWGNIFDDLCRKPDPKFDIILTPLFETRSRLYKFDIAYCSPIFYSNIGIYIKKSLFDGRKRSFRDAIHYIKDNGWKPEMLIGELSEALVQKHFLGYKIHEKSINSQPASDDDFVKVLKNINNSDPIEKKNNALGDFAFMEVFKANSIINQWKRQEKFDLVNILKDNELLYPVSFVVRKEDTVLRNLINLKLMELRESGKLELIIKKVAKEVYIDDDLEFKSIFVQGYDFAGLSV